MESDLDADASAIKLKDSVVKKGSERTEKGDDVPVNWARKAHTSDRIPIPDITNVSMNEDGTRVDLEDQTFYAQNEFVFVTPKLKPPPQHRDDIDYALPDAFRIARIMSFEGSGKFTEAHVNWLYRPSAISRRPQNTRELYATYQTSKCSLADFRGKCVVSNRSEIRNLARYCDKPSQFWVSKLYDDTTRRVYDVLPITALKSLTPELLESLGRSLSAVVVPAEHTRTLCEPLRKRKPHGPNAKPYLNAEADSADTKRKLLWPFRYLNVRTLSVDLEPGIPPDRPQYYSESPDQASAGKHIDVPDWPGKPLAYFTLAAHNPASGEPQKLRLLEAESDGNLWNVDTSLPWVQQMPKGYIARGTDITATNISMPLPNIDEFVKACQENYASKLDLDPHNLNFVDACCQAFTANEGNENQALIEVSRFTRRSIGEPELTATEKSAFEAAINPFQRNSWHDVFQAVKTKPIADLSQYFWSQRSITAIVAAEHQFWEVDPPFDAEGVECAVCNAEVVGLEWKHLPGYVPLSEAGTGTKKAMCPRCARIWYRYQVNWLPFPRVQELEQDGEYIESELIEDSKAVRAEDERRKKRKIAAQEKKEALDRKREETRQAKAEAKAAGKPLRQPTRKKARRETATPERTDSPEISEETTARDSPQHSIIDARTTTPTDTQGDTVAAGKAESLETQEADSEAETGMHVMRRRPNMTQLTLNSVEDILNSLSDDAPLDASASLQGCVVCGQLDISMAQNTCASCSLSVHIACYGPGQHNGHGPWLCDCCINSRDGLGLDTFYQCALCPPTQPTYARWLAGEAVGASDVLKGTFNKTWCHLRCAVWTSGVSFLNPAELNGIDLGTVDTGRHEGQCSICVSRALAARAEDPINTSTNGNKKIHAPQVGAPDLADHASTSGARVCCDKCNDTFHVSCAAEQGYTLGFAQSTSTPVIRCGRHGSAHNDLVPMSYVDLSSELTILQRFVRASKQSMRNGPMTAAERSEMILSNQMSLLSRESMEKSNLVVNATGLQLYPYTLKCVKCGGEKAPYWVASVNGYDCALCYRGKYWMPVPMADPGTAAVHGGLVKLLDATFTGEMLRK